MEFSQLKMLAMCESGRRSDVGRSCISLLMHPCPLPCPGNILMFKRRHGSILGARMKATRARLDNALPYSLLCPG